MRNIERPAEGRDAVIYPTATIANLVCGFDILGMALEEPADRMKIVFSDKAGIRINHIDNYGLPEKPEMNVAGAALLDMMKELPADFGFDVEIEKCIKPGSGLGSSAASAAGIVVAVNHLLGNPFSKPELVRFAMAGEKVACGVKHADNIAPCIFGGITLIRSVFPLDIIQLPAPPLHIAVVHPQIEVKTSDSRQILRKELLLKTAIKQFGNIAGLVAGLFMKDYELISRSLKDEIVEPVRSMLIPGFEEVKKRCLEAGALGGGISGSGPSIFMLCDTNKTALEVAEAMRSYYEKTGLDFHTHVTTVKTNPLSIK